MKNKLIILSDIWGKPKFDWLQLYIPILELYFDVKYYDVCQLAKIDTINSTKEKLHEQFIKGGIDKAIEELLRLETGKLTVLAFSIGGTIAWKAALLGLSVDNLYAISATRLRYENTVPNTIIHLYYGENDEYQPSQEWFDFHHLNKKTFINETHECYKKYDYAQMICNEIIG